MSTIDQIVKKENRRSTAANTEKTLLDIYQLAVLSDGWDDFTVFERANMFNEIRGLIELKREIEALKPELAAEFATEN